MGQPQGARVHCRPAAVEHPGALFAQIADPGAHRVAVAGQEKASHLWPGHQTGHIEEFHVLQRLKITLSKANPANGDICESLFACFSRAPIGELELDYGSYTPISFPSEILWTSLNTLTLRVTTDLTQPVRASSVAPLLHCQSV